MFEVPLGSLRLLGAREGRIRVIEQGHRGSLGYLSVIGPELRVPYVLIKPQSKQGAMCLTRLA
jgi:hypothetical protein